MADFDAAAFLRQQGHRVTSQRLLVLNVLQNHDQPLSAEEVHAEVHKLQPAIDLATIYRVLQFLQDVRLAAALMMQQGPQRYKYRAPGDNHHHLLCKQCGNNIQIPDVLLATLRSDVEKHYGFTLQVDHLLLPGQCNACRSSPIVNE